MRICVEIMYGVRRTRATRAVATRRNRGRKKTTAPPARSTRSKRSTRTSQSVGTDEEGDESQVEVSQNVSDAEAMQDRANEERSPQAPTDDCEYGGDGEQALSILNAIAEESSTIENGVGGGIYSTDGGRNVENEDSDVEETITPQAADSEETEGDINDVKLKEEQQGTATSLHSGEGDDDDDRESVGGNVELPENDNEVPQIKIKREREDPGLEEEVSGQSIDEKEVPELEDSPPPSVNVVLPSPIRSGFKIKSEVSSVDSLEESQGFSQEALEEIDVKHYTAVEETDTDHDFGDASVNGTKYNIIIVKNEEEPMEVETDELPAVPEAPSQEELYVTDIKYNVEEMTIIDEVTDDGGQEERTETAGVNEIGEQIGVGESGDGEDFRTEPDTEMVSEDELPTESSKGPLETEAVSDEELPDHTAAVDLPETEAVSEDELPPEKTDKKKKKAGAKKAAVSADKKKARSSEAQKRKLLDGDTYDPSSPTSENSCDESPAAKRAAVNNASGGIQAKPVVKARKSLPELEKYWKAVKEDPSDFTGWTYLLQYVDQENDIEAAREAYDAFLSHYPYCYGYWRKYADYEKRKGNKEKCEEVFERGLKAIPLSVDLWIHFLNYSKATYPEDEEHLRTQFEKAIGACGMEFRSDRLWESYIKWETEGKRLQNVTDLYDRLLAMPTQGYTNHFDNFQEHVSSNPPQKVLSVDEFLTLRREVLQLLKQYEQPAAVVDETAPGEEVEAPPGEEPDEQPVVKSDEETTALRERIISIRRKAHKITVSAVADRWNYEEGIKRPYFHVKPLERCQLKNWKEYLDYEIEQGDQERIIVLFERCLIACALYEEFWIKFIRYLEGLNGEPLDKIRNVYERACTIHHTKKPNLHLHWAVFEESHQNYDRASEILNNLEKLVPNMLQVAYRRINLERRCNNMDKVCALYEHYISSTKNKVISNNMAIKYARFCWKVKGDVEKAISILNKAVEKDKDNPRLYLQLIDMGLQQNPLNEDDIVSIIDQFLSRDTDPEQKVLFAQRKVEFLEDFGSDILSVQRAHDEFQRYFKQAKDRKKKSPELDAKNLDGTSKKAKSLSAVGDGTQIHSGHTPSHSSPQSAHSGASQQTAQPPSGAQPPTATTGTGQYPPPTYGQTGGYSQQPPTQGSYQGGQYPPTGPQQPPTPYSQPPYNQQYGQSSDPNYANYQNWGYSQTGYGGYNQGWGNYNYY
ncbi:pre-mRNA-processing factor 39 isoform X3 [Zootermopsis nevadensis]|uniref:pre-mRNA-processing factor 39 isoform X3 n=1 Tax=Zootermopsis nevadensis TaxID=136037 RepID=UPI000B8E669F|nr:pre-mRNA-processing factor 39 isoform X3 [Zootermopsis nevadensis]